MVTSRDDITARPLTASLTIDVAIRIGLLALLLYWSLKVIGPFLTVALWSAILTVALYPVFDWLAGRLRSRRLAAALITLLCLVIVIGPVTWLGFGLIGSVDFIIRGFDSKVFSIPLPAESVKSWPLVGEQVYRLWSDAATDVKAILLEVAPTLKPLGKLLRNGGFRPSGVRGGDHHRRLPLRARTAAGGFSRSAVATNLRSSQRGDAQARRQHHSQCVARRRRHRARPIVSCRAGIPGRGPSRRRLLQLRGARLGDHPDRTDDPVHSHRHLELDHAGDGECVDLHRLHGRRRPGGQCLAALRHGAWTDDADADHLRRGRRRNPRLRNQRSVHRSDRALGHVGAPGGLGAGRCSRAGPREISRPMRLPVSTRARAGNRSALRVNIAPARSGVRSTWPHRHTCPWTNAWALRPSPAAPSCGGSATGCGRCN